MSKRCLKSALIASATLLGPLLFNCEIIANELPSRTIEGSAAGAYTDSSDRTRHSVTSIPTLIRIELADPESAEHEQHEDLSESEDITIEADAQLVETVEESADCSIRDYKTTDTQLSPTDLASDSCRQNSQSR